MIVHVTLEGTLSEGVPSLEGGEGQVEVASDATVGDVLEALGLPRTGPVVAVVDGVAARAATAVQPGARLRLFRMAAGG